MSEQAINLTIFLILTPLIAVNIASLLWVTYRLHRDKLQELRPLMTAILLCHASSFVLSLTFAIALSVAQWGAVSDSMAIQPYLKGLFYVALAAMCLESLAIAWWRWR